MQHLQGFLLRLLLAKAQDGFQGGLIIRVFGLTLSAAQHIEIIDCDHPMSSPRRYRGAIATLNGVANINQLKT